MLLVAYWRNNNKYLRERRRVNTSVQLIKGLLLRKQNLESLSQYRWLTDTNPNDDNVLDGFGGSREELVSQLYVMRSVLNAVDKHREEEEELNAQVDD